MSTASLPTVLVAGWLIADARQPPAYSPVRQTVSVVAGHAGTDRWIMTASLYIVGAAYVATAAGLRALAPVPRGALVVAGAAAIGVASLPEPAQGSSGSHALCTGIGALTIAVWPALVAAQPGLLRTVGVVRSIVAIVVSAVLFGWTAWETRHGSALGLAERTSSAAQSCWPFVVVLAVARVQRLAPALDHLTCPGAALDREDDDQRP